MNQVPTPRDSAESTDVNSPSNVDSPVNGQLPAGAHQEADVAEPPIVGQRSVPVAGIHDPGGWLERFTDWTEETLGSESYGAPRVFDLFTLLSVTLAFALLFAFLKLLEPAFSTSMPMTMFAISSFLVLTGLGQAILWNGRKPRIASLVTGPINFAIVSLSLILLSSAPRSPAAMVGLVCFSISGLPLGYLAGTVVAGVFLLADKFRQRYMPAELQDEIPIDIWGDLPSKSKESSDSE